MDDPQEQQGDEIELKLELSPRAAEKLLSYPPIAGVKPHHEHQSSIYFDTRKAKLRRRGWTLRVRSAGGQSIQTIKRTGTYSGLFDRQEWESRVASSTFEETEIARTPLKDRLGSHTLAGLRPAFRTEIDRDCWMIETPSGSIQLTLDRGVIRAGQQTEPVCEVELEIKQGEVDDLFRVARDLARRVPSRIGVLSKSDLGYCLSNGGRDGPSVAPPVALCHDMSVAQAFAAVSSACLHHFRLNEAAFLDDRDAESLHQMRVALRRLRSGIWLFKPAVRGEQYQEIADRLRDFTKVLGAARDIDVCIAALSSQDSARPELQRERGRRYQAVLRKLRAPSIRNLLIEIVAWTHAGDWRGSRRANRPLMPFAVKRIDRLWSQIQESSDPGSLPQSEQHQLRIKIKKLRYSLEFLHQPLRSAKPDRKRFRDACEKLQDALGRLNDQAACRPLEAGAWLEFDQRGSAKGQIGVARRSFRKLCKIGPFWRRARET